jgi:hypothetical protein
MNSATNAVETHPLLTVAAIAVCFGGVAATAAILGFIPSAYSGSRAGSSDEMFAYGVATVGVRHGAAVYAPERIADSDQPGARSDATNCGNCGIIENVRTVQAAGHRSGLDEAAASLDRGYSRTVLGVLGAVGGAYGSHAIETWPRSATSYRVWVRMPDGSMHTVYSSTLPEFGVGERVRVVNGILAAMRG